MRETLLAVRVIEFDTLREVQEYAREHGGLALARFMGGVQGGCFDPGTDPPTIVIPRVDGVHSLGAAALGHEFQHALEHARGERTSEGE